MYIHQPYPKMLYHAEHGIKVVQNKEEHEALPEGWVDNPDKLKAVEVEESEESMQAAEAVIPVVEEQRKRGRGRR